MSTNPIGTTATFYKKYGPNPLLSAMLLGGAVYGAGRLAWNPIMETIRALGRPFASERSKEDPNAELKWDKSIDEIKRDSDLKYKLPIALGILTGLGSAATLVRPNERWFGLLDWDAKPRQTTLMSRPPAGSPDAYVVGETKTASLDPASPYISDIDWNKPIGATRATGLFTGDKHFDDDPYVRNLGVSIVSNAAISQGTRTPTLGNIFDSAVDKLEKKLSFSGVLGTAANAVAANGAARLFTSALDTMVGLPVGVQRGLIDAGTWAGTITSILN